MEEVKDKPAAKSQRILNPQRMGLAEHLRQQWMVNAEEGTTVEDVLDPQYWSHMAAQLQPYDRVDVLLETGDWLMELLVINRGRNWAQVHVLHKYDLEQRSETMPAAQKHRIEWKGPKHKHAVIRLADSQMIQDGFSSREEAGVWLANHEKVTG